MPADGHRALDLLRSIADPARRHGTRADHHWHLRGVRGLWLASCPGGAAPTGDRGRLQADSPVAFGGGATSSSDGQHSHVGGPGEAVGSVNARHGRDPAVSIYTHVSDRFAPFHTKLLPAAAGEAAHVVDGLLYHHADLDIAVHHTDGDGVSDHVFALCHLLDFRFAPRIPDLASRRLVTFGPATRWPTLGRSSQARSTRA